MTEPAGRQLAALLNRMKFLAARLSHGAEANTRRLGGLGGILDNPETLNWISRPPVKLSRSLRRPSSDRWSVSTEQMHALFANMISEGAPLNKYGACPKLIEWLDESDGYFSNGSIFDFLGGKRAILAYEQPLAPREHRYGFVAILLRPLDKERCSCVVDLSGGCEWNNPAILEPEMVWHTFYDNMKHHPDVKVAYLTKSYWGRGEWEWGPQHLRDEAVATGDVGYTSSVRERSVLLTERGAFPKFHDRDIDQLNKETWHAAYNKAIQGWIELDKRGLLTPGMLDGVTPGLWEGLETMVDPSELSRRFRGQASNSLLREMYAHAGPLILTPDPLYLAHPPKA